MLAPQLNVIEAEFRGFAFEGAAMALALLDAHLAQGAAFAAKACQRVGNPAPHTEMACAILCGLPADAAAAITDRAHEGLHITGEPDSYERWRQRIRAQFAEEAVPL